MGKILSKSGDSLADVYDVRGSIAGVEELLSEEINLVHEMGATIFNERLSARMVLLTTGAIAQNVKWNVNFSATETSRILGVVVLSSSPAEVNRAQLSVTSPPALDNTDVPFFVWAAGEPTQVIDVLIDGTVEGLQALLPATPANVPNLLIGFDSPRAAATLSFRGSMTAFGAGTAVVRAIVHLAFPSRSGLSSRGLPIPGW